MRWKRGRGHAHTDYEGVFGELFIEAFGGGGFEVKVEGLGWNCERGKDC